MFAFVELGVFVYKMVKLGAVYFPPILLMGELFAVIVVCYSRMCNDINRPYFIADIGFLFGTCLLEAIRIYLGRKGKGILLIENCNSSSVKHWNICCRFTE